MAEERIDLRGLKCPLPALRTKKALGRLESGDVLVAECTDPLTEIDIPHLARETGNEIIEATRTEGLFVFRIRKC